MARTMTWLEGLDDLHAAAAVRAGMVELLGEGCVLAGSVMGWLLRRTDLGRRSDELASAGELLGAGASAIRE